VLQCNNFPHELENASALKIKAPLVTQKFNKLLSCQQLQQTKFEISILSSADIQKVVSNYKIPIFITN